MDAGQYIREAAAYTRATLVGKWSRWLIIVLLGLPWLVLRSLVESSKIIRRYYHSLEPHPLGRGRTADNYRPVVQFFSPGLFRAADER